MEKRSSGCRVSTKAPVELLDELRADLESVIKRSLMEMLLATLHFLDHSSTVAVRAGISQRSFSGASPW